VVTRFFRRRLDEEKPLPDLAVIDGGKGQLGAAREALDALGVTQIGLISLAKKEEEIFLPGRSESVRLPRRSPALRMLQQARDEAHRFAVSFQRQKRAARTITSELLRIPGIGPNKRRALLHVFGSVQGVKEASVEAIAQVPGFGETSARKVLASLGVEALPSSGSAVAVSPDSEVPLSESPVPPPVSLPSSPEPYA
jgi:excinuclease ABC subunit C